MDGVSLQTSFLLHILTNGKQQVSHFVADVAWFFQSYTVNLFLPIEPILRF